MSTNPHASPLAVALFEAFARNSGNSASDHFDRNAAEQWMQQALDDCLPTPAAAQEAASKALARIRNVAEQPRTVEVHGRQFSDGMRRAANLLEEAIIKAKNNAPVAAAPVDLHAHLLHMLGAKDHEDAGRIIGELHASSMSTPAAPGVDPDGLSLTAKRLKDLIRNYRDHPKMTDFWRPAWCAVLRRMEELIAEIDASPKGGSDAEPMFYIQDTRSFVGNCPVWWGPEGRGYVTRLDEAGRYTEQEAIKQNRKRETDLPWPCDEIDKLGRITVDVQHMRPRRERLAELKAASAEVRS